MTFSRIFKIHSKDFNISERIVFPTIIIAVIIAADRLSKSIVLDRIVGGGRITIVRGFFALNYTENTGMAFSLFSGFPWILTVLRILGMTVLIYILIFRDIQNLLGIISLAAVIGGGIGNIIDVFAYGYVVDMFEFLFVKFAVFNIADSFVTCGVVCLGIYILFMHKFPDDKKKTVEAIDDKETTDGK